MHAPIPWPHSFYGDLILYHKSCYVLYMCRDIHAIQSIQMKVQIQFEQQNVCYTH
jgi:hypothetical protein